MLTKISKRSLFVRKRYLLNFKRHSFQFLFILMIIFISIIYFLIHYQQKLSLEINNQSLKPIIIQNRFDPITDQFKQDIYDECRLFSYRNHLMRPSSKIKQNQSNILEDVYILLYYSPKKDNEDGKYFQLATSYLLSQNLQQLSREQQKHTYITLFLNQTSSKLIQWFQHIYSPYTAKLEIIHLQTSNQSITEQMIKYIKFHRNIHFETILFVLKDDYIFDVDMLLDTIDFFLTHNPCFIYQTDFSDRCRFDTNHDVGHLLVPGKVRLWRSISSTQQTYACRLKTLLVFEDLIRSSKNDFEFDQQIRQRVDGNEIYFCAIPQYSARLETLVLPADINLTSNDDGISVYYKDWSSIARQALTHAQDQKEFPYSKINVRTIFS